MALKLTCPCGQQVLVDNSAGGQKVPCPQCRRLIVVPVLQPGMLAAAPSAPAPAPAPVSVPASVPLTSTQSAPEPVPPPKSAAAIAMPPPLPTEPSPVPPPLPSGRTEPEQAAAAKPDYAPPLLPTASAAAYVRQELPPALSGKNDFVRNLDDDDATPELADVRDQDQVDGAPRKKKKKDKHREQLRQEKKQLRIVSTGLALMHWGILCLLLGNVVVFLSQVIMGVMGGGIAYVASFTGSQSVETRAFATDSAAGVFTVFSIASVLILVLFMAAGVLLLIGAILCCWVPPQAKARGLIVACLSLEGGYVVMSGIAMILTILAVAGSAGSNRPETILAGLLLALILLVVAAIMGVAAFVLFFLFLKALAYYLDERSTGDEAMSVMTTWIVMTLTLPVVIVILVVIASITQFFPFIGLILAAIILFGGWLTWLFFWTKQFIRLVNVIGALRQVLAWHYGV